MELDIIWQDILTNFRKGNKSEALTCAQQTLKIVTDPIYKWRLGFLVVTILIDLNNTTEAKEVYKSLKDFETSLPTDFYNSDEYSGRILQLETMFFSLEQDLDIVSKLRNCVEEVVNSDISIYHAPARINLVLILYKLKEYELMNAVLQNIHDKPVLGVTFSITFVKTFRLILQDKPVDKLIETLMHTADTPFARWVLYQRLKIILDEKGIDLLAVMPTSESNFIIK